MANKDTTITQELLHQLFDYCDGCLYWKQNRGRARKGALAGSLSQEGYIRIGINGKYHKAHRLIFLMHNGYLPVEVDHINCDRSDNNIENLRQATKFQNQHNASLRADSTTKIKGVCWHKQHKKWYVQIQINKKRKRFGPFEDLELAEFVANEARKKLHGEYARLG